ncbi:hypothetical protein CHELA1G11_12005 [Hyphomicrobiales bacterium]|nr:hypothetical protein CHELA1G11_12005 [Hyphomicrobiales bacterium]CAH1663954.1 hypothetical protein CHELA1G2_12307 [Hyphomicrobiales bacterium]
MSISGTAYEGALTRFPIPDIPRRMGRPPLKKDADTWATHIRLTADLRSRIEALVGPKRMAAFIRDAVEKELKRREQEAKPPRAKPSDD